MWKKVDRLCVLVVRVPGYWTEKYCVSCEVRTRFTYIMQKKVDRPCLCTEFKIPCIHSCAPNSEQPVSTSVQLFVLKLVETNPKVRIPATCLCTVLRPESARQQHLPTSLKVQFRFLLSPCSLYVLHVLSWEVTYWQRWNGRVNLRTTLWGHGMAAESPCFTVWTAIRSNHLYTFLIRNIDKAYRVHHYSHLLSVQSGSPLKLPGYQSRTSHVVCLLSIHGCKAWEMLDSRPMRLLGT
jgi:hypothetical protein